MHNEENGQNDNRIQFPFHHPHVASLFVGFFLKKKKNIECIKLNNYVEVYVCAYIFPPGICTYILQ